MHPRTIPFVVGALVLVSLVLAILFYRHQKETTSATVAVTETASPVASPTPDPSASPSVAASPTPAVLSNPNPDLTVDTNGLSKSTVVVQTNRGIIKFKFYSKDAPLTSARIVALVTKGFYNSLTFHRVVPNFVVQGGDPTGTGTGGSGERLKAEFNSRRHLDGSVGMARSSDPDSADSQFYFTMGPQPHLDHNYTVFGQVTEGMDVVRQLQVGDKMVSVLIQ